MGFVPAKDRPAGFPRIIISVSGLEKQGKTHFGFSAPGPIAYFSTDIGDEGVVEKFMADKKIEIMEIDREAQADKEWKRFLDASNYALSGNDFRTIIYDTATELWELLRLARFGKLTQVMPYQYGPVNKEYRDFIKSFYRHDKNVVLLHKMKAEYIADKRTGNYERAGFSDTGFLVQVNAQMWRYGVEDGGDFVCSVRDCRQNPDIAGMDFEGMMCNFPMVAQMVLPDSDSEAWED